MNWKGCGRKQLQPNLRYYSGIGLGKLKKEQKKVAQECVELNTTTITVIITASNNIRS
jgi:hypothetical protein